MSRELNIKIPSENAGSYKIQIGADFLGSLWPRLEEHFNRHHKFIVSDQQVAAAGHLKELTGAREVCSYIISPAGEYSKNINTVVSIIENMEKAGLGRDTLVIALGGGTVGDIAGFAASVFKRGVPVVQIPTTTVAQADSSIGGKTGVDSSLSKNAFGSFWHPSAVYIDVAILKTLEDRQYKAGLVESVKHALIADAGYFDFLEDNIERILQRETSVLEEIAVLNCRIKGEVVEADPTEKNKRRILNYGHTIGHAVESASGFSLLHGEAVAIGIIGAGLIEIETGIGSTERLNRVITLLEKLGMPLKIPDNLKDKDLMGIIEHDKKAVNKWPKFVLLEDTGRVYCLEGHWAVDVNRNLVNRILDEMKE